MCTCVRIFLLVRIILIFVFNLFVPCFTAMFFFMLVVCVSFVVDDLDRSLDEFSLVIVKLECDILFC